MDKAEIRVLVYMMIYKSDYSRKATVKWLFKALCVTDGVKANLNVLINLKAQLKTENLHHHCYVIVYDTGVTEVIHNPHDSIILLVCSNSQN